MVVIVRRGRFFYAFSTSTGCVKRVGQAGFVYIVRFVCAWGVGDPVMKLACFGVSLWPLGVCGLGWRVCALVVHIEAAVYVADTYVHI